MKKKSLLLYFPGTVFFANAQNAAIGVTIPTAKLSISVNGTESGGTASGNTGISTVEEQIVFWGFRKRIVENY